MSRGPRAGFTLVEVLVALAIVALALAAGAQAAGALAGNATRQSNVMLAQLCAENELVRVRLARQLPGVGERRVACRQANIDFEVAVTAAPTPNPNFLRVDAQVFESAVPLLRISTVVGRY
jgi:general secretion pathway protein I